MIECVVCGSTKIGKSLMAPSVTASRKKAKAPTVTEPKTEAAQSVLSAPDPKVADAIRELREHVEANSDYVGRDFAKKATAMHLGDEPNRSIYGEVAPEEAKQMAEDGVPAIPLPFMPKSKTN